VGVRVIPKTTKEVWKCGLNVKTILIAVFDLRFGTLCLLLEVNLNQDFCLFFGLCEKQRERAWDLGTNMAVFFLSLLL
jgi:hypothetical protein